MKASLMMLLAPLAAMAVPTNEPRQAAQSIDKLIKAKGKLYFGTCTDQGLLTRSGAKNAAIIEKNFGQVTPENSMKWSSINNQKGSYNWGQADYLVNWATERNISIRGHTLVWHSQLAGWVSNIKDKAALTSAMEEHITSVMGRWKGKIRGWVGFSPSLSLWLRTSINKPRTSSTRCSTRMARCAPRSSPTCSGRSS